MKKPQAFKNTWDFDISLHKKYDEKRKCKKVIYKSITCGNLGSTNLQKESEALLGHRGSY